MKVDVHDVNDEDQLSAVAFSPAGDVVFHVAQGNGILNAADPLSEATLANSAQVGEAPQGLVVSADGQRLFAQNLLGRSISVFDIAGLTGPFTGKLEKVKETVIVAEEPLSEVVLRGKKIYYRAEDPRMTQDGYVSCASCHVDGDSDGRVWDFTDRGEGLRNTTQIAGRGGLKHGPVHWTANFDEIQDFEHDIRGPFGGRGFMTDELFNAGTRNTPLGDAKAGHSADLDALAAYVASLDAVSPSPLRNADGSMTAEAKQGEAVFKRLRCGTCHAGTEFTDSPAGFMHDVGTLKATSGKRLGGTLTGLDTPTLKGIWETPPYLHDGSAATLLEVLGVGGNRHGELSSLSAADKAQLVAYLSQLDESSAMQPPSELHTFKLVDGSGAPLKAAAKVVVLEGREVLVSVQGEAKGAVVLRDRSGKMVAAVSDSPRLDAPVTLAGADLERLRRGELVLAVGDASGSWMTPPPPTNVGAKPPTNGGGSPGDERKSDKKGTFGCTVATSGEANTTLLFFALAAFIVRLGRRPRR